MTSGLLFGGRLPDGSADLHPRRGDDVPRSTERVDALSGDLAGLPVGDEVVQRVSRVGNFGGAVRAPGRAEE